MSALADALVAAQRRALAQLEKEFVRSVQEDPAERAADFRDALTLMGLTDRTEVDALVNCLEILRTTGGALPAEPTNGARSNPETDKATDAQLALIAKLVKEKGHPPPDLPLTKAEAHEIINTIKAGTYEPRQWQVPF